MNGITWTEFFLPTEFRNRNQFYTNPHPKARICILRKISSFNFAEKGNPFSFAIQFPKEMNKLYLLAGILLFGITGFAQIIKYDSVDVERQHAALPYYSYGKGLGLTSPDSIFQLNIRFRMQNRLTYW